MPEQHGIADGTEKNRPGHQAGYGQPGRVTSPARQDHTDKPDDGSNKIEAGIELRASCIL